MSAGAVFKLIANDGKADRLIMATALLNQRIKDVMCARRKARLDDITPTLVDLERTHILYVNNHFKPYAAIGFEYNKVQPSSGSSRLGQSVQFSIPQFGDFFNDMVIRLRLSSFYGNTGTTPVQALGTVAAPSVFPLNATDATGGALAFASYNLTDVLGNQLVAGVAANPTATVDYRNLVHYCEYPGIRAFKNTRFEVNGNPLDAYSSFIPMMLEKFCVAPNKRVGHDRLLGQEVPLTGFSGLFASLVTDADAANTPTGITKAVSSQSNQTVGLYDFQDAALAPAINGPLSPATVLTTLNAVSPQYDVTRKMYQYVNGAQTPKPVQPPLELWNALRFWFNDDVRNSIASVSIPYGQRFITVDLEVQDALTFEFPSLYLQRFLADGAVSGPYADELTGPGREMDISYSPIAQQFGTSAITVEKIELYINNIFVNPEIHDIYIQRIGFSLIRVYREQTSRQTAAGNVLLSQLKWPVEYIFAGMRPVWNITKTTAGTNFLVTGGNLNQWRDWHHLTRIVDARVDDPDYSLSIDVGSFNTSRIERVIADRYWLPVSTVDSMSLTAHGNTLYDSFSDMFFNNYLPYHFGGAGITTPDDTGAMFINMALFPRSYQPSGHLNISRSRETYIHWTSTYLSEATPSDLIAVAIAINFLLVSDGSAVLRYST